MSTKQNNQKLTTSYNMTPFIFVFICLILITVLPCGSAKMRGKVYGIGGSSSASRRRRKAQKMENEKKHKDMLDARKAIPLINIWQSDIRNGKPDNCEFCKNLNATWFHGIKNREQNMDLSPEDLQKMKELYLQYVYTPWNFPITWRDANGQSLKLRDITEEEIKNYYFDRCPRAPIHIMDVISFLGTVAATFSGIVMLAVMCT